MASTSGASSGSSSQLTNTGSNEDLQVVMDQRKRKRMLSNRESARRSRLRKQKHLEDLKAQVSQLRKENSQIMATHNLITQYYISLETENSVLRTQVMELSSRLNSLNDILQYMNFNNSSGDPQMMLSMELLYMNHPITASSDMLHYY